MDLGLCCVTANRINYSLSKAKALLYTVAVTQHRPQVSQHLLIAIWLDPVRAKFAIYADT